MTSCRRRHCEEVDQKCYVTNATTSFRLLNSFSNHTESLIPGQRSQHSQTHLPRPFSNTPLQHLRPKQRLLVAIPAHDAKLGAGITCMNRLNFSHHGCFKAITRTERPGATCVARIHVRGKKTASCLNFGFSVFQEIFRVFQEKSRRFQVKVHASACRVKVGGG